MVAWWLVLASAMAALLAYWIWWRLTHHRVLRYAVLARNRPIRDYPRQIPLRRIVFKIDGALGDDLKVWYWTWEKKSHEPPAL